MINAIKARNLGPLPDFEWKNLSLINLILGPNGCGKTFLLKAIYTLQKSIEHFQKGNEIKSLQELVSEKLYWMFQPEKLGDIVCKPNKGPLEFSMTIDGEDVSFSFGADTYKKATVSSSTTTAHNDIKSIFIPAKEVISIQNTILKSKMDRNFGFDDAYVDLAEALRMPLSKGRKYKSFSDSRNKLSEFVGGRIEFDQKKNMWIFKENNNVKIPMGITSEGTKKIAILDTLLGNNYLSHGSIIIIDEPESGLHPRAVSELMEIISILGKKDIQFFIATHSYFVIKKLFIIAMKNNISIPVVSIEKDGISYDDLQKGMPKNAIIDESVRMYEEEIDLVLQ